MGVIGDLVFSDEIAPELEDMRFPNGTSRKPIECPNCCKIVTQARNLKRHLRICRIKKWTHWKT